MARVKRAVNAQKKRRTALEQASGYRGQRSRLYRKAKEQMLHSLNYAYRDRRARKGDFRQLWITRINAAARQNGMTYNRFIQGLKTAGVEVDRKILAELAVSEPAAFAALVDVARANVPATRRDRRLSTPAHHHRNPDPPGTERTPRVVAARKLLRRAGRDRAGRFLVEGAQAVREALAVATVHELFVTAAAAERHPELVAGARADGVRVLPVTDRVAEVLSDTVTPQGIVAVCDLLDVPVRAALAGPPALVAVLVGVADPGNAGTVVRVADAAGAGAVLLAGDTVDPHNGKAVRASTGSVFHVPLARARDAAAALGACRAAGLTLLAADGRGELDLHDPRAAAVLAGPTAWVFGGRGPRTRAGAGRSRGPPGAGANPRPGREPEPRDGRCGVPLRERAGVTRRLSAAASTAPPRRPVAAGSAPTPRARTPTGPARDRAGSTRGTRPR